MDGRELKAYERFKEQAQLYRAIAYDREAELRAGGDHAIWVAAVGLGLRAESRSVCRRARGPPTCISRAGLP